MSKHRSCHIEITLDKQAVCQEVTAVYSTTQSFFHFHTILLERKCWYREINV